MAVQTGETFDYIIVGAGSAGCVLAERLSADGRHKVLVLEFGGSDRSVFIQMPSALSIPMNTQKYNWGYESEPEPHLGGRRLHAPRGKGLGGSSSINGLVYVRGNPRDFELWQDLGAQGWGYANVLPYFRRAERRQEGGDAWRGDDGPLDTCYGPMKNPLYQAWIDAAQQAGYPLTDDINGAQQEGFGRMDMTVRDGARCSAAKAFLHPAAKRPNVTVLTHARATKVLMDGRKAIGVAYERGGMMHEARATREVILSGGAFNAPQLLKLSGIGPADELATMGIPVVADRPGVGANLQDHLEFYFQYSCTQPVTLYSSMNWFAKGLIGAQWLLTGKGLGASNHFESCGFIRSRAGIAYPDIQYHFFPLAVRYDGKAMVGGHGFQAHVGPMRSKSRGSVTLRSPDPRDPPVIRFNYMSHDDDWADMRAGVRLTREIFQQTAFDPFRGTEIAPGTEVTTDDQIDDFIRDKVESGYHPCGTCKMGRADDPMAVVDNSLRVIGVEGLRVVDASVMPHITTGNLNAPTIMIGEKASDHILGKPLLAPSNAPWYTAPDWETSQR
ncbi:MAG: choline dehydrogenase [Sphingomonas sp.]